MLSLNLISLTQLILRRWRNCYPQIKWGRVKYEEPISSTENIPQYTGNIRPTSWKDAGPEIHNHRAFRNALPQPMIRAKTPSFETDSPNTNIMSIYIYIYMYIYIYINICIYIYIYISYIWWISHICPWFSQMFTRIFPYLAMPFPCHAQDTPSSFDAKKHDNHLRRDVQKIR